MIESKLALAERHAKQKHWTLLEQDLRTLEKDAQITQSPHWDEFVGSKENDTQAIMDRLLRLKDPSPYELGMILGELKERERLRSYKDSLSRRIRAAREALAKRARAIVR